MRGERGQSVGEYAIMLSVALAFVFVSGHHLARVILPLMEKVWRLLQ
jgi:hypothetical protein